MLLDADELVAKVLLLIVELAVEEYTLLEVTMLDVG